MAKALSATAMAGFGGVFVGYATLAQRVPATVNALGACMPHLLASNGNQHDPDNANQSTGRHPPAVELQAFKSWCIGRASEKLCNGREGAGGMGGTRPSWGFAELT